MTGESIIYFAKEWGEDRTSCDHVFEQLARNNKVLWVNSIATRTPNLASAHDWVRIFRKLRQCLGGFQQVGPSAWVYQPIVVPLPHSNLAQKVNRWLLRRSLRRLARRLGMGRPQLWTFLPNTAYIIGQLDESVVVYYCVDAWSEFSYIEGRKMASLERQLLEKSDLCFGTAYSLTESLRRHNPNTFLALHGVDYRTFSRALDPPTGMPADAAEWKHPVIGYFGALQDWIDLELIAAMARAHPEWSLVLIGKEQINLDGLRAFRNIHILGRRPYESLPGYCKVFDVAIIPFVVNDLTRHVNPIKLREYLSAGLPVVSTDLPEVRQCGDLVYVAGSHEEFIAQVERALREDTPSRRLQRSEAMGNETWEAKVAEVCAQVMKAKAARAGRQKR